uniref:Uncharacterized protein n=1 Tax=viral metagenome TaxID=1070528 RepID=A0A2V0RMW8_9ZZZZ
MNSTKEYAIEVATTALNSFHKQARGDLEAPNGDENVGMYTARGGSAVTLTANTTSAAVVFDAEASLRKGQLDVVVYERNSANQVVAQQRVNLGRPTNEFLSAGVLSSALKVFNSSGVDVIGGTQSAAVLTSVPRDISKITSTDLANNCANHERDLASGIVSREDSTMTMAMTDHFGKKMALSRNNTLGNLVLRSWDDGVGARGTTTGQSLTFTGTAGMTILHSSSFTDAQILENSDTPKDLTTAGALRRFLDTARLDEQYNPLTLACYHASVNVRCVFADTDVTNAGQGYSAVIMALDSADNIIASKEVSDRVAANDGSTLDARFYGSITSSTSPIARIVVGARKTNLAATDNMIVESYAEVIAYEETSDIAARPIHVCVFEGLNASATININSAAVLTGVPDSTNVFISSKSSSNDVYDTNAVEVFLRSVTRVMPRAFTIDGHAAMVSSVDAMFGTEDVSIAFQAMSFEKVAKKVKKIGKVAKARAQEIPALLSELAPALEEIGSTLSMLPGPAGTAGQAMRSIGRLSR